MVLICQVIDLHVGLQFCLGQLQHLLSLTNNDACLTELYLLHVT